MVSMGANNDGPMPFGQQPGEYQIHPAVSHVELNTAMATLVGALNHGRVEGVPIHISLS